MRQEMEILRLALLLQFAFFFVCVKQKSCEGGTIAPKVARCPPWGRSTKEARQVGSGIVCWGRQPKHESRLRSTGAVTC